MGTEIERKYLVRGDGYRAGASSVAIRQGYLSRGGRSVVRVRRAGDKAFLTIKSDRSGIARAEFEYAIPGPDAEAMLAELCEPPLLEKTRYRVRHRGVLFEVDVFEGANAGLVLAEVELAAADQTVALPDWIGRDVTDDPRFRNESLAKRAFDPRWLVDEAPS